MSGQQSWEKIAADRRAQLGEQIPPEYRIPKDILPPEDQLDVTQFPKSSGWFSGKELEITGSSASGILQKIASKSWSAEEVAKAFCKAAAAAHQLVRSATIATIDLLMI